MNEDKLLDAVTLYVDRMGLSELLDYARSNMYDELWELPASTQLEFIDRVNRDE